MKAERKPKTSLSQPPNPNQSQTNQQNTWIATVLNHSQPQPTRATGVLSLLALQLPVPLFPLRSTLRCGQHGVKLLLQRAWSGTGRKSAVWAVGLGFAQNDTLKSLTWPIRSMYGIFTNIYPINHPNVGKYTIHGAFGWHSWNMFETWHGSWNLFSLGQYLGHTCHVCTPSVINPTTHNAECTQCHPYGKF